MYQKLNSKWLCIINSDKFNPSLFGKKNVPCAVKSQRVCRRKAPFEILGTFWVQGGDPQYVAVFSLSNCHNHVWPILVNFFCKKRMPHILPRRWKQDWGPVSVMKPLAIAAARATYYWGVPRTPHPLKVTGYFEAWITLKGVEIFSTPSSHL